MHDLPLVSDARKFDTTPRWHRWTGTRAHARVARIVRDSCAGIAIVLVALVAVELLSVGLIEWSRVSLLTQLAGGVGIMVGLSVVFAAASRRHRELPPS
jgi:hypothetical protein